MRPTVTIVFAEGEIQTSLGVGDSPLTPEEARRWLDRTYLDLDCELMRATGKVLNADKLLAVADAIGHRGFDAEAPMRLAYARAALGAMARDAVHVDLQAQKVTATS